MSLGILLHQPWPIWDLRSAVFPLGVVFPAQYSAHLAGVHDVGSLVLTGRLVVAVLSTVSIWLVWSIGRWLWPDEAGFAIVAAGLFATAKLSVAFGSSELPRPVSTVFVLGAFAALQRRDATSWRWAGAALAFAASLRFSEAIFGAAALTQLVLERRYRQAAGLALTTAVISATLLGLADAAYWGEAFHSVRAAFDFTMVQRLSSRGFQPPWWYVVAVGQWSTGTDRHPCRRRAAPSTQLRHLGDRPAVCAERAAPQGGALHDSCRAIRLHPCGRGSAPVDRVPRHREAGMASGGSHVRAVPGPNP